MEVRFIPLGGLTLEEYKEIYRLRSAVWPPKEPSTPEEKYEEYKSRKAEHPEGFSVVYDDGGLVGTAFIGERIIGTGRGDIPVMALGGVCSDPALRGRGYGAEAVKKVFSYIGGDGYPVCLFQTSFKVEPFYLKLGAKRIANRIFNSNAQKKLETVKKTKRQVFWDDIVMIYPGAYDWPEGDVDIRGPGF